MTRKKQKVLFYPTCQSRERTTFQIIEASGDSHFPFSAIQSSHNLGKLTGGCRDLEEEQVFVPTSLFFCSRCFYFYKHVFLQTVDRRATEMINRANWVWLNLNDKSLKCARAGWEWGPLSKIKYKDPAQLLTICNQLWICKSKNSIISFYYPFLSGSLSFYLWNQATINREAH